MPTFIRRLDWWLAVPVAIALGALIALGADRASAPATAQGGGGFTLSVQQLRINQRISQAAVRRSNEARERLDSLETGGAGQGPPGPPGPPGPAGPQGAPAESTGTDGTFVHRLTGGQEATLASNGPLRYFARCTIHPMTAILEIFVISTIDDAYSSSQGSLTAGSEAGAVFAVDAAPPNPEWLPEPGSDQEKRDSAFARSGGREHYLGIDGTTLWGGVNIFEPGTCVVAGSFVRGTSE